MLALVLLVLIDFVRERRVVGMSREWIPLGVVALALFVFATGGVIAIGTWTLIDIEFKSRLLGRSARRAFRLDRVLRADASRDGPRTSSFPPATAASLLTAALLLQVVDLSAVHERVANLRRKRTRTQQDPTHGSAMGLARGWTPSLTLLPPRPAVKSAAPYLPMLFFAADHGMAFNSVSCALGHAQGALLRIAGRELTEGAWSADDLYVLGPDWKARFRDSAPAAAARIWTAMKLASSMCPRRPDRDRSSCAPNPARVSCER